jgi:hypothetical protein
VQKQLDVCHYYFSFSLFLFYKVSFLLVNWWNWWLIYVFFLLVLFLQCLFPGMWLDSITPDCYKVHEAPSKVWFCVDFLFVLRIFFLSSSSSLSFFFHFLVDGSVNQWNRKRNWWLAVVVLSKIIVNMGFSYFLAKVENEENNDEEDMFFIYIYIMTMWFIF